MCLCAPCAPHTDQVSGALPANTLADLLRRFAEHAADLGVEKGEFLSAVAAREDGAVLAVAQETASRQQILLACCHLFWNPNFPDVKAAQASLLVKQVRHRIGRHNSAPTVRLTCIHGVYPSIELTCFRSYRSSGSMRTMGYRKRDRCCWEATSTVRRAHKCCNAMWSEASLNQRG